MRLRTVLLPIAAALLALPASAHAVTACNLVKDAPNDAGLGSPASPMKAPSFDIRSLDVASGKKTFVVVLRMASTNYADEPAAKLGMSWDVTFKVNDVDHRFSRKINAAGTVTETATQNGSEIKGVKVSTAGNAITWTVPRSGMPKLKKGAVATSFFSNTSAPTATYDMAPDRGVASPARYTDGQKSCVKAA